MRGMDIELISQSEAGCCFEVEETGTTFEGRTLISRPPP